MRMHNPNSYNSRLRFRQTDKASDKPEQLIKNVAAPLRLALQFCLNLSPLHTSSSSVLPQSGFLRLVAIDLHARTNSSALNGNNCSAANLSGREHFLQRCSSGSFWARRSASPPRCEYQLQVCLFFSTMREQ